MPRGYRTSPELRAEVVSVVLTGMSVTAAAKHYNLNKSMISRWVKAHTAATGETPPFTRARDPDVLENLIYDLVAQLCVTLRTQLQATAQRTWLEKQEAGQIAQLLGIETERLIRLLSGFRPVERADSDAGSPKLELGAAAAPDPAAD